MTLILSDDGSQHRRVGADSGIGVKCNRILGTRQGGNLGPNKKLRVVGNNTGQSPVKTRSLVASRSFWRPRC